MIKLIPDSLASYFRGLFPVSAYMRENTSEYKSSYEGITVVIYKGAKPSNIDADFPSPSARASDALLVYTSIASPGQNSGPYHITEPPQHEEFYSRDVQVQLNSGSEIERAISSGQAIWWAMWTQTANSDPSSLILPAYDSTTPFSGAVFIGDVTTTADGTGEIQYDDTLIQENVEYVLQPFNLHIDRWLSRANLKGYSKVSIGRDDTRSGDYDCIMGVALKENGDALPWGTLPYYDSTSREYITVDTNGDESMLFEQPPAGPFADVVAGYMQHVGLRADGTLAVWGFYEVGSQPPSSTVNVTGTYTKISASGNSYMGLRSDGSVHVWGHNGNRQISDRPWDTDFVDIAHLSASGYICGALKSDGTVVAWGANGGANSIIDNAPSLSSLASLCKKSTLTSGSAAALTDDGSIILWPASSSPAYTTAPTESGFAKVVVGNNVGVGLKEDGSVVAWGKTSSNGTDISDTLTNRIKHFGVNFVDVDISEEDEIAVVSEEGDLFVLLKSYFGNAGFNEVPDLYM